VTATIELAPGLVRALERHETEAHAIGGRELVDQGDALALIDPADPDPFWNRIVSLRWPSHPAAFDRRLEQAITFFATRNRRPHVWPTVSGDEPPDLVNRLVASGFADTGRGILMAREISALRDRVQPAHGTAVEMVRAGAALTLIADVARVLAEAFSPRGEPEEGEDPRDAPAIEAATLAVAADLARLLSDPRVAFALARIDGVPAAAAKVTSGSGLAYLSSIGTRPPYRGRGLAALVTRRALVEGQSSGGSLAYLGVFEGNVRAVRLYARLGFAIVGRPVPDLVLTGQT